MTKIELKTHMRINLRYLKKQSQRVQVLTAQRKSKVHYIIIDLGKQNCEQNIQQLNRNKTDHLKDSMKIEMASNFDSNQNDRTPSYGNVADGDIKWVKIG
jgi:hypothetical protein